MATINPLHPILRSELPDPLIPWGISPETFGRMVGPTKETPYKVTQLLPTDPEWNFVWRTFHHQKPTKYSLGKVLVIHERHQQNAFEQNLSAQEREAPKFPPNWKEEPRAAQRAQAIERWKETTAQFSPFESMESDGRRRSWQATKVLPLFHGTAKEISRSICESGHTFFGKTSLSKTAGGPKSTDDGYFGSGIYFTSSARYAADIYSQGHLLISWISMREPFPFVGDPTQEDMTKLRGKGAYKNYNAHYIPVTSADPTDPNCPEYYPTQEGQLPTCDEYVVFQAAQTLPRFWIHLTVDAIFLKTLSAKPHYAEDLIPHLMTILQNPHVDADKKLRRCLNEKLAFLLTQKPEEYLEDLQLDTLFDELQTLLDPAGKVNRQAAKALMGASAGAGPAPATPSPTKHKDDLVEDVEESLKIAPQLSSSSLPSIAFGALKWQHYFGLEVIEPPLPPDIDTILAARCPFFPSKRVGETHFLTLVPEDMTLERLEVLTLNPRQGSKMGFRNKAGTFSKISKLSSGRAHWVLMPNDVVPNSRSKSWKKQKVMAAQYEGQGYELLSVIDGAVCLLLEHVQTGKRFYSDSPLTFTRCVETVKVLFSKYPVAIGGFASGGLGVLYDLGVANGNIGLGLARKFF